MFFNFPIPMTTISTQEYIIISSQTQHMSQQSADRKIEYKYFQQIVLLSFLAKFGAKITLTKKKRKDIKVNSPLRVKTIEFENASEPINFQ